MGLDVRMRIVTIILVVMFGPSRLLYSLFLFPMMIHLAGGAAALSDMALSFSTLAVPPSYTSG